MATCKACIHFDVCRNATIPNPEYKGAVEDKSKTCRNFKNKADVAEVKHGEWERQKDGFFFLCSNCGKAAATKGNFCHNCGAKMDERSENHER